jgi:PST family polysaccharide transporter
MGRTQLHKAIHNSGWIFFDKILRAALGLLVGAWVARYLGPSQYGELTYCIAFIAIFQALTNLGLDGIVVREISGNNGRASIVLGTVFQLRLLLGIACWIFALIIYGISNGFSGQGIWIIAFVGAGMIFQAGDTVDLWFQSNSQSKRTVIAKTYAYLVSNGVKVTLLLLKAPLIAFAAAITLEGAIGALALFISYKKYPSQGIWIKNGIEAKKLLLESWPYLISGISIMVYMRIDQLMIKSMLGEHELGIYAAVLAISSLWNMVPVTICASIAPFMTRKKLESTSHYDDALVKMFRIFWLIAIGIIIATITLSSFVIRLIFGEAYNEAASVLNIYVLTSIPVFMGVGQSLWLINERKSYISIIQTGSGALLSIITNLIFLPWLGLSGAAIAAVFSYFVSAIGINILFSRELFMMQLGVKPKRG